MTRVGHRFVIVYHTFLVQAADPLSTSMGDGCYSLLRVYYRAVVTQRDTTSSMKWQTRIVETYQQLLYQSRG